MKRLTLLPALFGLGSLTACNSAPHDKVEQINHLSVPVTFPDTKSPPAQVSHIASLYQQNKQQIDSLTHSLKSRYLQNTTTKDIFTRDSPVEPVYASLTKLEQLELVNRQYMKDNNFTGLQNIHIALQPLMSS